MFHCHTLSPWTVACQQQVSLFAQFVRLILRYSIANMHPQVWQLGPGTRSSNPASRSTMTSLNYIELMPITMLQKLVYLKFDT